MPKDINHELIESGLSPGSWQDSLSVIKSVLSPTDWDKFNRLHRNFTSYRSAQTLTAFYDFAFSHDLHLEINRQRFKRIAGILEVLLKKVERGCHILDIGAGTGIIGTQIKRHCAPASYVVQDPCRKAREWLANQGFDVLDPSLPQAITEAITQAKTQAKTQAFPQTHMTPFDLILCIDSLGEINADEDGLLSETSDLEETEYCRLLEERYGIALKLESWKGFLAKEGRILFWEPFKHHRAWKAMAMVLDQAGWNVTMQMDTEGRPNLALTLT